MNTILRDVRYALRAMRLSPSFTFIAVFCLGLGIGATSTIFGIVDVLFFRPPPGVADPASIVRPYIERDTGAVQTTVGGNDRVSFPDYVDMRDNNRTLSGLAAFTNVALSVGRGDEAHSADGVEVTGNYFNVLGVRPALGRFFVAEEDAGPGSPLAVVISHYYWQRMYGGDRAILGKNILVDGHEYPIVGVAPDGFRGIDPGVIDLWVPFAQDEKLGHSETALTTRFSVMYQTVGRLARGATRESAASDLGAIVRHAAESTPALDPTPEVKLGPIFSARGPVPSNQAKLSRWLALAAALLLAIACANTANLLLARAAGRRREIAIRLSIGAGRSRIVRQLLTESVLLALFGAVLGVVLASWGTGIVPAEGLPRLDFFARGRVLWFAVIAAVTCGVIFGLAPAISATRADLSIALKQGVREGADRRSRLRSALMVVQVALAVVLLSGAGLFVHSLRNVQSIDPGFDVDHMLRVSIDLKTAGYSDTARAELYSRAVDALRETPGVRGAAITTMTPLSGSMYITGFRVPGFDDPATSDPSLNIRRMMSGDYPLSVSVGSGYFGAVGTPVLEGRDFAPSDRGRSQPVAIVNQRFAKHYWPSASPIGQCIDIGDANEAKCYTVVGVAADAKYVQVEEDGRPAFFVPTAQMSGNQDRYILVRTSGDPLAAIPNVRATLQRLAANLPYVNVQTLSDVLRPQLQPRRLGAALFGAFGILALALAAIGLYGVISYAVAQRTREVGIRLALGAQPAQVLRLVVRQGVLLTVLGLGIGIAGALVGARLIAHFLFGVSATDPITFAGVCVALGAVAALASYIPARRAARVDPIVALRSE
jgi:Acidobacterial duplicated orphan permease